MPMTALDYEEIRQLSARYVRAADFGDVEAFAACFAPQAVFVLTGAITDARPAGRYVGTAELRRLAEDNFANTKGHVRHWNSPPVIDGDSETARAFSCLAVVRVGETPRAGIILTAVYWDVLAKVDGRWLYVERRASPDPQPEHQSAVLSDPLVLRHDALTSL